MTLSGTRASLLVPCALAALMVAASVTALLARPDKGAHSPLASFSLDAMVPRQFGEWREDTSVRVAVVNPQTQALLDKLYSQVLSRTYIHREGYRVMLVLAYGSDQRGALQAHKPEVCYPAQGFTVKSIRPDVLRTPYGPIPVQRLDTALGRRHEPVTYWFTVGNEAVSGKIQKRLVDLSFGLTGRIPDGMLFRISSIDGDPVRAFNAQDAFVQALLDSVSADERRRLSGLGEAAPRPLSRFGRRLSGEG
jgi:EpsI family protein